jgi:hypothetical protein
MTETIRHQRGVRGATDQEEQVMRLNPRVICGASLFLALIPVPVGAQSAANPAINAWSVSPHERTCTFVTATALAICTPKDWPANDTMTVVLHISLPGLALVQPPAFCAGLRTMAATTDPELKVGEIIVDDYDAAKASEPHYRSLRLHCFTNDAWTLDNAR